MFPPATDDPAGLSGHATNLSGPHLPVGDLQVFVPFALIVNSRNWGRYWSLLSVRLQLRAAWNAS